MGGVLIGARHLKGEIRGEGRSNSMLGEGILGRSVGKVGRWAGLIEARHVKGRKVGAFDKGNVSNSPFFPDKNRRNASLSLTGKQGISRVCTSSQDSSKESQGRKREKRKKRRKKKKKKR